MNTLNFLCKLTTKISKLNMSKITIIPKHKEREGNRITKPKYKLHNVNC